LSLWLLLLLGRQAVLKQVVECCFRMGHPCNNSALNSPLESLAVFKKTKFGFFLTNSFFFNLKLTDSNRKKTINKTF
jgi:hypothetical protein